MAEPSRWQRYVDAAVNDPRTGGESQAGSREAAGRGAVSRHSARGSRQLAPGRAGPAGNGPEFRQRLRGRLRDQLRARLRARLVPDPAVPAGSEDRRRRTDLRLVPPALLVWGTAVAGSWLAPAALAALCPVLMASAGVLLARAGARRGTRAAGGIRTNPGARGQRAAGRGRESGRPATRSFLTTLAMALLLSTAAGAHSAVAASLRHEGAVAEAATAHAAVVVELEIAGTPRRLRVPGRSGLADRWAVPATLLVMYAEGRRVQAGAGLLVMGGADWEHLVPGQRLRATGNLKPPEPGQSAAGILSASSAPTTLRAPDGWQQGPATLRRSFTAAAAWLGGDARGLLPGMVTGDTGALDAGLEAAMKTVGMTHLTAVSGANCSLILGTLLLAARSLRFPRPAAAAVSLAGLGMFVLMVGPDASVLRAALMGAIGVSCVAFGRAGRGLSFLCLAVTGLLLLDPALSVSFGFLLSVLATLGIVVAGRPIMEWLPAAVPRWAAAGLAVPLSAQVFCGPVIVLLQPQFSAYALPANLAAAVLVPPVTLLGTAAVPLVPLVPGAAAALMAVAGASAGGVAGIARFFAALPGAALPWPEGIFGLSTMALLSVLCLAALRLALHPAAAVRLAVAAHSRTLALLDRTPATPPGRPGRPGRRRRGLVERSRRGRLRLCKQTSGRNRQWLLPRPNAPGRRRRTRPPGVT